MNLLDLCSSKEQRELVKAYQQAGSITKAAKIVGRDRSNCSKSIKRLEAKIAQQQFTAGTATVNTSPGFQLGKVTTQRKPEYTCPECGYHDPERILNIWDRQHPEPVDAILSALHDYKPKPKPKIKPPKKQLKSNLLNLFTITDFHLGMYAWEAECGDSWDTRIAGESFYNAIRRMHQVSPNAETALLNIQGDWCHWDGLDSVTPQNNHILDADTRFGKMIELSMDLIEWAIEFLLSKYKNVHVIVAEGNHDLASSKWLQKHFSRLFRDNPRCHIDNTEFPYYAHLFGKTLIGIHHGHKKKNAQLPALFSEEPRYRPLWGQAVYCYIHTGHLHTESMQISENGGALVIRHPTLAARDAYAVRGGWNAQRGAYIFTYDDEGQEVCRYKVTPEAL